MEILHSPLVYRQRIIDKCLMAVNIQSSQLGINQALQLNFNCQRSRSQYHRVYHTGTCVEISQHYWHSTDSILHVPTRQLTMFTTPYNFALVYSSQSIILQSVGINSEAMSHNVTTDSC